MVGFAAYNVFVILTGLQVLWHVGLLVGSFISSKDQNNNKQYLIHGNKVPSYCSCYAWDQMYIFVCFGIFRLLVNPVFHEPIKHIQMR